MLKLLGSHESPPTWTGDGTDESAQVVLGKLLGTCRLQMDRVTYCRAFKVMWSSLFIY